MFLIFLSLIKFTLADYSDNSGIYYDSEERKVLIKVPRNTISENFVIIASVEQISGNDYLTSPFFDCRDLLNIVSFEEGSNLVSMAPQVFMYSSIKEIDFTNCKYLTKISQGTFYQCKQLSSIILPPNVEEIGEGAIRKTIIEELVFPDSLTTVANYDNEWGGAIGDNSKLKRIVISQNSSLSKLGTNCFASCPIESLYFPNSLQKVTMPIYNCHYLTRFEIEKDHPSFRLDDKGYLLLNLEKDTILLAATGIKESLTIPEGIIKIDRYAFRSAYFTEIHFSQKVELSHLCFGSTFFESITIPNETNTIPSEAFEYNKKLKTVILPNTITKIDIYAFYGCDSLIDINLQEGLQTISNSAFASCKSLQKITIPASVKELGSSVFADCHQNLNITFLNETRFNFKDNLIFQGEDLKEFIGLPGSNITIPYYCNKIPEYLFKNKNISYVTIEDSTEELLIEREAFLGSTINSITFRSRMKLGIDAFRECNQLKVINFTNVSIEEIPESCFSNCNGLETVIFDNSDIKRIGSKAFYLCSHLENLEMNDSEIEEFGDNSFQGISVEKVEFPVTVSYIGSYAFSYSGIQTLIFPLSATITNISKLAFSNSQLQNIVFPDLLTVIPGNSFANCPFTNITLGKGVTNISGYAFSGCQNLQQITIPANSSLKTIEPFAFSGCESLTEINIEPSNDFVFDDGMLMNEKQTKIIYFLPTSSKSTLIISGSIEEIADNAFHSCPNIRELYIPVGNLNKIGFSSFYNCTKLSRIILPQTNNGGLYSISNDAFKECKNLQCGCIDLPDALMKNETEIERIGISYSLVGDYCVQKGCFVSFSQRSCNYHCHNNFRISSLFIILGAYSSKF